MPAQRLLSGAMLPLKNGKKKSRRCAAARPRGPGSFRYPEGDARQSSETHHETDAKEVRDGLFASPLTVRTEQRGQFEQPGDHRNRVNRLAGLKCSADGIQHPPGPK